MVVILLEALGALALLVLIVWWTMFHGRSRGERREAPPPAPLAEPRAGDPVPDNHARPPGRPGDAG